ncbi:MULTISPECIES: hypothetical protein [unclassified Streptomyces]|uniref:hypothetical protein n=1 Tax=unclassified Streptomyces TaxID=2593676 RepID=UPI0023653DFE|nr:MULTISPECIES: hypothetical protein [unclassified Streptomyces]MDF3146373.1 hypothetical protein [Streptomyces sp. T21Q-yed]WDF39690.1 hypothetical protein PBV52_24280 [Streptomyces sp. T12]
MAVEPEEARPVAVGPEESPDAAAPCGPSRPYDTPLPHNPTNSPATSTTSVPADRSA